MADYIFTPIATNVVERIVTAKAEGITTVEIENEETGADYKENPPLVVVLAPYN